MLIYFSLPCEKWIKLVKTKREIEVNYDLIDPFVYS